jgi:carboxypeptidase Q
MKLPKTLTMFATLLWAGPLAAQLATDSATLRLLANTVLQKGRAHENLRVLCKQIGPRLSGSANAQKAVEATAAMLKAAGADTVYLQPCMVPHWVRGQKEKAIAYLGGKPRAMNACALGMSVATRSPGLRAPIVEVATFAALDQLDSDAVTGKIVFFNYPMRPDLVNGGYGDAVRYRTNGPVAAAKKGAIAVVVRSVTYALDSNPHTGTTRYDSSVNKIPAFAISTLDAEWLHATLAANPGTEVFLQSHCQTLPDAPSFNVVGELRGSTFPQDIITTGGHLDSWDLGEGAHDDGAGVAQAIEVLHAIAASGLRPKRTIRAVLFINEENGLAGGNKYAELAEKSANNHLFAIESDAGGSGVVSLGLTGKPDQVAKVQAWLPLLKPYGVLDLPTGGGGADINPLRRLGTFTASLNPGGQRYFDHHHAATDVFETVNKRELELGAMGMTAICWLISEHGL